MESIGQLLTIWQAFEFFGDDLEISRLFYYGFQWENTPKGVQLLDFEAQIIIWLHLFISWVLVKIL